MRARRYRAAWRGARRSRVRRSASGLASVGFGGLRSLMPPPPRSAGSRRSRRRSDRSRSSSSWVPMPTISPSSSTRIWSASAIVATRWPTMITAPSRYRPPARPAAGRRWPRRARRTSRRTGRSPALHQRAGDRQALPLPAGDVGAALGDRRVELPGMPRTKSAAWAISQRLPRAPRRWRRACRSAGCWPPCRRTGTASAGTRPIRLQSSVGIEVADVDAVDQHVARRSRRTGGGSGEQRGLAGAGGADDGRRLPGRGRAGDVAEHRRFGARVGELGVAQLDRRRDSAGR